MGPELNTQPIPELLATLGPDVLTSPYDYSIIVDLMRRTGLLDEISSDDFGGTLFAQDDIAFVYAAVDFGYEFTVPEPDVDEIAAYFFWIDKLTELGAGDPQPLLERIAAYHILPEAILYDDLPQRVGIPTRSGDSFVRNGSILEDNGSDFSGAQTTGTDLIASNGIVHTISGVLMPFDIPETNGTNQVRVLIADPSGSTLQGESDNDLLIDGSGLDDLRGAAGGDAFQMSKDGQRDLLRDFQPGSDLIDVSSFAAGLDDIEISNVVNGRGVVRWLAITDRDGNDELLVRFDNGTPMDASDLGEDSFMFADTDLSPSQPQIVLGGLTRDDLRGTMAPEVFVMQDDGILDTIRNFELGSDVIDVSTFANSFDDLELANRLKRNGDVNWIEISDQDDDVEMLLRLTDRDNQDAGLLGAGDFVFG